MQQYNIVFSKKIDKFLDKHPEVIERFFACIEKLVLDPYNAILDIKPLQ
jgi:hypothetical protein